MLEKFSKRHLSVCRVDGLVRKQVSDRAFVANHVAIDVDADEHRGHRFRFAAEMPLVVDRYRRRIALLADAEHADSDQLAVAEGCCSDCGEFSRAVDVGEIRR